jgi:crotonobetainyl-CoA:carnitine CoA-transferase CaiB-like acyl-CoA transferase
MRSSDVPLFILMNSNGAPLTGIRVLSLTSGMPGAIATMMLADYGADVVAVVSPRDSAAATRTWERGRRLLTIDVDDDAARATIIDLARDADVVIVGLDTGSSLRLGLDSCSITALNPTVIYVALTGFGLDDDRLTPAYEPLAAAELGAMVASTGANRSGPVYLGHPAVAYSTALLAVAGILAALRARIVGGVGDVVDVSLLDGVLAQFTMNWWTERNVSFLAARRPDGQLDLGRTRMLVRRYTCSDGRNIQVHTGAAGAFSRLMTLLGISDEISPATGSVEAASPLTEGDVRRIERIGEIFATKTAAEWLQAIWSNEIAALPVLAPAEAFDDPQVVHNRLIRIVDDPQLGPIEVVAPPIALSLTPALTNGPSSAVEPGGVTWNASGLAPGGSESLAEGPLTGVTLVELATFFASPYANRLLRDLGADIIKVEPTSGDPMRTLPDPFEGASRGKRSIAVDLKSPQGRGIIAGLVGTADVVQHNFRPGVAERLGVDDASVRLVNPHVVYCFAPGFGSSGPKSMLQSFAPLHSGFVGVFTEAAGVGNPPTGTFGNEDYYNGQLNAIGMLLALVHKARTGQGQYVECAQLSSSVFVTSHWYRINGERQSTAGQLDHDQWGVSPFQRLYQCLEGYICIHCTSLEQRAALVGAVIGGPADGDVAAIDDDALGYHFFGRTATDWVDELGAAGIPCTVASEDMWLYSYLRDPAQIAAGRAVPFEHWQHGNVSVIGRMIRLGRYPAREPVRAPLLGEHTAEILGELGMSPEDVDTLVSSGIVGVQR